MSKPAYSVGFVYETEMPVIYKPLELSTQGLQGAWKTLGEGAGWEDSYRYRVGGWRIVYHVGEGPETAVAASVGPRGDVYRHLDYATPGSSGLQAADGRQWRCNGQKVWFLVLVETRDWVVCSAR